jgi:hypothetical protein
MHPLIAPHPAHAETFTVTDGRRVRIACDCEIGENHEYADWLALTYDETLPICELGAA